MLDVILQVTEVLVKKGCVQPILAEGTFLHCCGPLGLKMVALMEAKSLVQFNGDVIPQGFGRGRTTVELYWVRTYRGVELGILGFHISKVSLYILSEDHIPQDCRTDHW